MLTRFGYTLITEQSGPREFVRYAVGAERAGFDFEVSSDHYFPWLTAMGHAPHAWTVLGAGRPGHRAGRTDDLCDLSAEPLPPRRHRAEGGDAGDPVRRPLRTRLGSGENLNEHVVGAPWPVARVRQEMLAEALEIIRALHGGDQVSWAGKHFTVESAKVWDLPDEPVQIGVAVSGDSSIAKFAPLAGHLVGVELDADLVIGWDTARAEAKSPAGRKIGQLPICWGPDKAKAVQRAHELFRWFGGGWHVNADLPTPIAFDAASQYVTPDDVADSIACGPDLDELAESFRAFLDAGFTDVAVVQIGDESQDEVLAEVADPLLDKLRALSR